MTRFIRRKQIHVKHVMLNILIMFAVFDNVSIATPLCCVSEIDYHEQQILLHDGISLVITRE